MRKSTRPRSNQQGITVTMITTVELYDAIPLGKPTRKTDGRHRRFGARIAHPDFFYRRHPFTNRASHFHFEQIRDAKRNAALRHLVNRVGDRDRRVTQDVRPPRSDVVDVMLAIDVFDPRTRGTADEKRLATHISECTDGRIHAARNNLLGCSKHFLGERALHVHGRTMNEELQTSNREAQKTSEKMRPIDLEGTPIGQIPEKFRSFTFWNPCFVCSWLFIVQTP